MVLDPESVSRIVQLLSIHNLSGSYLTGSDKIRFLVEGTHLTGELVLSEGQGREFCVRLDPTVFRTMLQALGKSGAVEIRSKGSQIQISSDLGEGSLPVQHLNGIDLHSDRPPSFEGSVEVDGFELEQAFSRACASTDSLSDISSAVIISPQDSGSYIYTVLRTRISLFYSSQQLPECVLDSRSIFGILKFLTGTCRILNVRTGFWLETPHGVFRLPYSAVTVPDVLGFFKEKFDEVVRVNTSQLRSVLSIPMGASVVEFEAKDALFAVVQGFGSELRVKVGDPSEELVFENFHVPVPISPLRSVVSKLVSNCFTLKIGPKFVLIEEDEPVRSKYLIIRSVK